jgi:hypothetical protein
VNIFELASGDWEGTEFVIGSSESFYIRDSSGASLGIGAAGSITASLGSTFTFAGTLAGTAGTFAGTLTPSTPTPSITFDFRKIHGEDIRPYIVRVVVERGTLGIDSSLLSFKLNSGPGYRVVHFTGGATWVLGRNPDILVEPE